ncbi:response regulator [Geomonas agri]|uniref:response regulator n=1 Tax=Geomonas agri TaxID=2873702 RepID=UPI001CD3D827|nr:response regulator [Geomonas agri]
MSYVNHTILVVDNDQDQAHFTKLALQRVGVITPVQSARDGEEAIGYLSGRGTFQDRECYPMPVLMLLDLKLPHISGVGLLSWLREQPALKRLPVVVLTTQVPPVDLNRAYELGCNSFLFKPNSFNALLVMMQNLVQYWLGLNVAPELAAHHQAQEHSGTSI